MSVKVYKSACRMCHGGCGTLLHVDNGRLVAVEGDPDSPMNRGRLCVKGRATLETVYNPARLLHPLRRRGPRGGGEWERLSWDGALDDIAERLLRIRETDGARSIALGTGTGRHHFNFVPRFANALGTPNWCEPGTAQCFMPRLNASLATCGDLPFCDYLGPVKPACILVWGHNPLVSSPDGELGFSLRDVLARDPQLIVVDPRRTALARRARLWLQLRPGSDAALALAMVHTIIHEGLYDADFVSRWTVGFRRLAAHVEPFTPRWAEPLTWIPAKRIRDAARLFAQTPPATLEWGCAIEHTPAAFQTCRALLLLPVLTGNLDRPGGFVTGAHALARFPFLDELLPPRERARRLGARRFKMLAGAGSPLPSAHAPTLFRAMRTGHPYPVRAFLVWGNNSLSTYANSRNVRRYLLSMDLLVVTDLYMTPTARLADFVLPAASWPEIRQILAVPFVAENLVLANQKAVSVGECLQDEEIMIRLSRRMDLPGNTEDLEEVLDARLAPLGLDFQELARRGFHLAKGHDHEYRKERGFRTPSRKVELYSRRLEHLGTEPLPGYGEPPESPFSAPDVAARFPLVLTSRGRVAEYFNSEFRQLPSLRRRHPHPLVELHPETAGRHGIQDGQWIWIESPRGRIKQKARLTSGIDPRVVAVEHGWWFPELPGPEHGVFESNANLLTNDGPPYDPAMGTYQLRALLCRVRPCNSR